jgi:hypothetical protein
MGLIANNRQGYLSRRYWQWDTSATPAPDGTKYAKGDDVENVKRSLAPRESTD